MNPKTQSELRGATPIHTQRATFTPSRAIPFATEAQQGSLKELVERRFSRNNRRNARATNMENTCNFTSSQQADLVATVAKGNEPLEGVEIEVGGLVDIWGRKQCLSCSHWEFHRCNNSANTVHDNWDGVIHFLPYPALWWRCELHSFDNK